MIKLKRNILLFFCFSILFIIESKTVNAFQGDLVIHSSVNLTSNLTKEYLNVDLNASSYLNTEPEQYELAFFNWYQNSILASFDRNECDSLTAFVTMSDVIYAERLEKILSPIDMTYNKIVKSHIVDYLARNKAYLGRSIGVAQYYFPIIEEILAKNNMPLELKILPVVESSLSPLAVSTMGATGLWQFMYTTAKAYDLEVSSFVDERQDPVLATEAACRYLKDMYNIYGDWILAIAAYNCGPGNVNKAFRRAGQGAKDYWDIYEYLPTETRKYIPSFIAASYAYTYYKDYGIEVPEVRVYPMVDTLHINQLLHFQQISSTIGISLDTIRALNPQYKLDIIPAHNKSYVLTLPREAIVNFIENEDEILKKDTTYLTQYIRPNPTDKKMKEFDLNIKSTYKVKNGDTLGHIAVKHDVSVRQIISWNRLKNSGHLKIGQVLRVK